MKNILKVLCLMFAAIMILSAFAGCVQKPDNGGDTTEPADTTEPVAEENNYEKDKAEYDAMTAEQLVEKYVADPANITIEEYADLISTFAFVEVEDGSFVYQNKTKDALDLVKDAGGTIPKSSESDLAKIMAAKPYANSRAYYYVLLSSFIVPKDSEGYNALLEQYKKEEDPFVIACVIQGLSHTFAADADFAKYALSYATSDNYYARLRLSMALDEFEGMDEEVVQAALTLLADTEGNIAYHMAETCGRIRDERFVEPIVALLGNAEKADVHNYALKGLIDMWFLNGTSEAAYKATMDYYKAESTDPKYPAWDTLTKFTTVVASRYDKWIAEATYFNPTEFVEVMKGLVADAEAQKLIKTTAVKVIGAFGTADDLNALKPLVESSPDKDAIVAEIDKELAKK